MILRKEENKKLAQALMALDEAVDIMGDVVDKKIETVVYVWLLDRGYIELNNVDTLLINHMFYDTLMGKVDFELSMNEFEDRYLIGVNVCER